MAAAKVVDPAAQPDRARIWFGATVTVVDDSEVERTLTLVGDDEIDTEAGLISWRSPLGTALKGAVVGDVRRVTLPGGVRAHEVIRVEYPGP